MSASGVGLREQIQRALLWMYMSVQLHWRDEHNCYTRYYLIWCIDDVKVIGHIMIDIITCMLVSSL